MGAPDRIGGVRDEALLVTGQSISLRSLVVERLRLAIVTGRFRPFAALRALSEAIIAGDDALTERLCTEHLESGSRAARIIVEAGYSIPGTVAGPGIAA